MKYIQNIVQTNNEKRVSYIMLALASSVVVLFVAYITLMYQVTHIAYAINKQEKESIEYVDRVAHLENLYHTKRREVTEEAITQVGFAKIVQAQYVSTDTERYTLAR